MNDHEIVEALRNRTVGGLTALYDTYAEPVHAYCWLLLGDDAAAREVLGEALVVAEAHIEKLADPAQLRLWLYAIARNECLRRRREQPRGLESQVAALDELLAGSSPGEGFGDGAARQTGPGQAGMSGVPDVMVAPGVLGVPNRPAEATSEGPATDPGLDAEAGSEAGSEVDDAGPTDDADSDASGGEGVGEEQGARAQSTPPLGIAAALGDREGRHRGAPSAHDDADAPPDGDEGDEASLGGERDEQGPSPRYEQPDASGEPTGDGNEGVRIAERVLGAIPPAEREVLELSFRHGLTVPQIALVVGVPVQQAQAMLGHADQQVRSGLAVERLATGGGLGSTELADRLERGEPPPAAVVLSVRPPELPAQLKDEIIGTFTAAEKIGYRLHVGRRAAPFERNGFPVPLDGASAVEGEAAAGEAVPERRGSWRWPAVGVGAAACLAAALAALLLWPSSNTEEATTASAPGAGVTDAPAAPFPTIQPSVTASPTATPSTSPQATPGPTTTIPGPQVLPPGGNDQGDQGSGGGDPGGGGKKKPSKSPTRPSDPDPTPSWPWTPGPSTPPPASP